MSQFPNSWQNFVMELFGKWTSGGCFLYSPFYKFLASMTPNLQIRNKSCAPEVLVIFTIIIA